MEIRPATLAMLTRGRNGQYVAIDDDVQGVANALAQIDPHICLRYSEPGEYYVVYWKPEGAEEGEGELITTAQEIDHRIVKRIEELQWKSSQPGYSYADELDRVEAENKAKEEADYTERHGPAMERLAHAMRKDSGVTGARAFVPEDIPEGSEE